MKLSTAALALSALFGTAAFAHHSYAMFDRSNEVTVTGTVTKWVWANPHTTLVLMVPGQQGEVEWTFEGGGPQTLRNKGWNRDAVAVGQKVTVHMYPLKDGSNGGQMVGVDTPDGQQYRGG
jgi:hypothetical protein